MMVWEFKQPGMTPDDLGFLPFMLSAADPRPAREQFDANYQHGGGWNSFRGFTMTEDGLSYPGDPIAPLLAEVKLREETIRVYLYSWVAIIQPDGSYDIARLD